MLWNEPATERERHGRAMVYVLVALVVALYGYQVLGFDQGRTLACAVLAYVLLNVRNYRAMFGRPRYPEHERDG